MKEGLIAVSGGQVYFQTYGSDEQNIPLIVVHGGPGSCHDTLTALAPLSRNRMLVFYDQLGCGKSTQLADLNSYSLALYVEELETIINFFGFNSYHLLGHSFGACLVIEQALKKPSALRKIILSSPLISVKQWISDTASRKNELPEEVINVINQHEQLGTINSQEYKNCVKIFNQNFLCRLDPKPEFYIEARRKFNADLYNFLWGPSEFNCQGKLADYERFEQLKLINNKTLFLCGAFDEVLEKTLKKYQQATPNSTAHVFSHSSHSAYLEETEEYIKVVDDFLVYPPHHRSGP